MSATVSSFMPSGNAAVTRNGDVLTFPFNERPRAMSIYTRFFDRGNVGPGQARLWGIGSLSGGVNGALYVTFNGIWGTRFLPRGVAFASVANVAPNVGDLVEILATLADNGATQLTQVLNGGVPFVAAASAPTPLPPAWLAPTLFL